MWLRNNRASEEVSEARNTARARGKKAKYVNSAYIIAEAAAEPPHGDVVKTRHNRENVSIMQSVICVS